MNNDLTEDKALEFANAMGETYPPTNINLINKHIDWWENNYPQFAPVVREWYENWILYINDKQAIDYREYDESYDEFMNFLSDLPDTIKQ